jgi:hypothetical protein
MPVLLSAFYSVSPEDFEATGAFDSFVDLDSRLHIDPHLLAGSSAPEMSEAARQLEDFFRDTIALIEAAGSKDGILGRDVVKRLTLPEVKGVSLGYSKDEGDGSAVGRGLANVLAERAFHIVAAGSKNPRIFEIAGLFTDAFGADRISDVVLRVARRSFARYTQRVCEELGIPRSPVDIEGVRYELPSYSVRGRQHPRYFVPRDVLRELPVALDRDELWSASEYNESVRGRLNELFATVGREAQEPSKQTLWDRVKQRPELLAAILEAYEAAVGEPYDFANDPAAELRRFIDAQKAARQAPLALLAPAGGWTPQLALEVTRKICLQFKALVENNGVWELFWTSRKSGFKPVIERAVQRVFLATALTYCEAGEHDLDISAEPNAGRGPVDFKFSHGKAAKVTVEVKKSNNGKLVHGYETQLANYNRAENAKSSIYLIVRVSDDDAKIKQVLALEAARRALGENPPEVIIVDARPQQSASKAQRAQTGAH